VRLFIAINLPDAEKTRLTRALQAIATSEPAIRWTDAAALHITVKFLGEIAEPRVHAMAASLEEAAAGAAAFDVALSGFGAFPSLSRPNILWVGVQAAPGLAELHGRIERAFEPLGFAADNRVFRPHITVARMRKDGRIRDRQAMDRMKASFDYKTEFRAASVDLMQSRLGRGAARYEILQEMELH
jgi:2'-5' RNA ligase